MNKLDVDTRMEAFRILNTTVLHPELRTAEEIEAMHRHVAAGRFKRQSNAWWFQKGRLEALEWARGK